MYEYNAKIVRVVDGDTVDVDIDLGFGVWLKKQRIRLFEIDTPEKRTRNKLEKQAGILATEFVESLCPVGSYVILKSHIDKRGKYGRLLGEIYTKDGTDIISQLILNKLGVAYTGQSKELIKEEHEANFEILIKENKINRI